jgi:hypothetical protein
MIEIDYDGKWPCLCMGNLVVTIDDKRWEFGTHCLSSGGSVTFDSNWSETVTDGEWSIRDWPEGFPEDMKEAVTDEVNSEVTHGCCGGCV